jgi:hypothetical protein
MMARRRVSSPYLDSVRNRRLAGFTLDASPSYLHSYVEPFLDGGAVAIALMQRHPDAVFRLNSANPELLDVWRVVRADVEAFLDAVALLGEQHGPAFFAAARDLSTDAVARMPPVERAARFVYLRGTARPDAAGGPLQWFGDAAYGRETMAFDEASVRGLAELLRDTDVRFSTESLFGMLPNVGEDDLVLLDPPFGREPASERELRSFASAVAAKGAFLLAPGGAHPESASASGGDAYAGWPGMSRLDAGTDDDVLWVNSVLLRALRREGRS